MTAPETDAEAAQQDAWRHLIEDDPVRARQDADLLARYKTPLFVNANIHGNGWEGTAGVAGTRANDAGYDLNRDLTIVSQPETRLIRDLVVQTRPIITLDLHGYVTPTLLDPSTPPRNVNNEYDLFIKHGLPNALNIEQGLNGQSAAAGKASIVRALAPGGTGLTLIGTSPTFRLHAKGLQPQLGRALLWAAAPLTAAAATQTESTVGGSVPATLSLTLGAPASFGSFTPGVEHTNAAGTTARIVSTAGDAALHVTDPSPAAPGHLVNGAFSLPQPLRVAGSSLPAVIETWAAPTSNEAVAVGCEQPIGAGDALRTGTYSKTLTFTLSTTTP